MRPFVSTWRLSSITVNVPCGTDVKALVATFSISGMGVKVGANTQVSGRTANDFTGPVAYTVTAADGTAVTYLVTLKVAGISFSHCVEHPGDCTWTGKSSSAAGPLTIVADPVTFQFDHADGDKVTFKPVDGTVTETEPPCAVTPGSQQITPSNSGTISMMTIDYAQSPPTYFIIAGTRWPGCVVCGRVRVCEGLGGPWCGDVAYPVEGSVSEDGKTIEGTASTIPSYTWKFTRNYTLDITCPQ